MVFDRGGRLPEDSQLARSAGQHPLLVTGASPAEALADLAERGVTSLLLEGGPTLAASFLAEGLIDRIALFVAPLVLGDGPGLFAGWAAAGLDTAPRAVHLEARPVGPDILLVAELREV